MVLKKMLKFIERYKWFFATLVIVSAFFSLACMKTGWYVDEVYSYGHASSSEGSFLNGNFQNLELEDRYNLHHRWIKGDIFHNYLTVQKNERFHYQHIWHNLQYSVHPPLFYVLLHTLRSFLPEGFGKWSGLALNGAILLLLLWWFYRLAIVVLKDKNWAFGATCFFAFLPIILEMSLYIRMYLLETAFFVGLLAQTLPLLEENKISLKRAIKIFCLAVLCYMTHFYGLIYAFFLSVGVCGCLLFRKRYDPLLCYAGVMLLSVAVTVLIYPAFWKVILFSERGMESSAAIQVFHWSLFGALFEQMLVEITYAIFYMRCWVWMILLGFVLLFGRTKISAIGAILLFTALGSMFLLTIVAPNMGAFNGRYYVGSIAAFYMAIVYALYQLVKCSPRGVRIISIIAIILSVTNFIVMQHSPYLGRTSEIAEVTELVKGKKVILQRQNVYGVFNLVPAFQYAQSVYILFVNDDVEQVMQSENFNKGSLVIQEAGLGGKKYKSKAFLEKNPALGLRFIGQYSIDLVCYDIYEKI